MRIGCSVIVLDCGGAADRINALDEAAFHTLIDAAEHHRPGAMKFFGWVIEALYSGVASHAGPLADELGRRIDGHLDVALMPARILAHRAQQQPLTMVQARAMRAIYVVWSAWLLSLFRTAVQARRTEDAWNFADRLRRARSELAEWSDAFGITELARARNTLIVAEIYLIGWCIRDMSQPTPGDAAREILSRLVDDESDSGGLPSRETLLQAWEEVSSSDDGGGLIDATRWDRDESMRTGIVYTSSGPSWPTHGLYAALCVAESEPSWHVNRVLKPIPPANTPSADEVQTQLTSLLDTNVIREMLSLGGDDVRNHAIAEVTQLFAHRRRHRKLQELRKVVQSPVSATAIEQLRTAAAVSALKEPSLAHAFLQLGVAAPAAATAEFLPVGLHIDQPKALLVEGLASSYINAGDVMGSRLIQTWQSRVLFELEQLTMAKSTAQAEQDLPTRIAAAADLLRSRGLEPNVLIIPRQQRFIQPFFASTFAWQRGRREDLGDDHLGIWHGIHVFRCPYANAAAAMLMDTRSLFAASGEAADLLVEVTPVDQLAHQAMLEHGEQVSDEAEVPNARDVRATVKTTLRGPLMLCRPSAAVKVDLDLSLLGYVQPAGSNQYHRPGCVHASGPGSSLSRNDPATGELRAPCPACNPDEWDYPL